MNALKTLRAMKHKKGQAVAWDMIGAVHLMKEEMPLALSCQSEAQKFCRQAEDRKGEAITLLNIANSYLTLYNQACDAPLAGKDARSAALKDAAVQSAGR